MWPIIFMEEERLKGIHIYNFNSLLLVPLGLFLLKTSISSTQVMRKKPSQLAEHLLRVWVFGFYKGWHQSSTEFLYLGRLNNEGLPCHREIPCCGLCGGWRKTEGFLCGRQASGGGVNTVRSMSDQRYA